MVIAGAARPRSPGDLPPGEVVGPGEPRLPIYLWRSRNEFAARGACERGRVGPMSDVSHADTRGTGSCMDEAQIPVGSWRLAKVPHPATQIVLTRLLSEDRHA